MFAAVRSVLRGAEQRCARPCRLRRHLLTHHPELQEKPVDFFAGKLDTLKKMKLDCSGTFHETTTKLTRASYELSFLIAKAKKAQGSAKIW